MGWCIPNTRNNQSYHSTQKTNPEHTGTKRNKKAFHKKKEKKKDNKKKKEARTAVQLLVPLTGANEPAAQGRHDTAFGTSL